MHPNWPTDWLSDESEIRELLARWRGFHGQVWEYMVSHGQLLLRLYRSEDGVTKNCYVFCKGCDRVAFDAWWKDADLQIAVVPRSYAGREGRAFIIADGSRLRVECRVLFAAETEQTLWIPRPSDYVEA